MISRFITVLLLGRDDGGLEHIEGQLGYPQGFEVERASSLDDAVDRLARFAFDIVILDVARRRRLDTIIRLRQSAPRVPILVVSRSQDEPELAERLRALGAACYISADTPGVELREAVLTVCA